MTGNTNVQGSIWVLPRIPDEVVGTLPDDGEVNIEQPTDTYEYSFISPYEEKRDGSRIKDDVQAIVDALGNGYTYKYGLQCFDEDDPSDRWRVRVTDDRQAISERPQVVYPGDPGYQDNPAPHAAAADKPNPGDEVDKLASLGDQLYSLLVKMWHQHEDTAEGMREVTAGPAAMLNEGYPLTGSLEEIIANVGQWTTRLRCLAPQLNNRIDGTAMAIRHHNQAVAAEISRDPGRYDIENKDNGGEIYASTVRTGLGGVFGDVAGAWNPNVTDRVSVLLNTITANLGPDHPVYQAADNWSSHYLAARRNDDPRN